MSEYGNIAASYIDKISEIYCNAFVERYVVMPNHINLLLNALEENNGRTMFAPTVQQIIKQYKGAVTKRIGRSVWQKSFYDRIIRDEDEYVHICEYMDNNPAHWAEDEYYNQ